MDIVKFFPFNNYVISSVKEGRGKKEEGRREKEKGIRRKEEGRRKKEKGRRKKGEGRRERIRIFFYRAIIRT
ncbi:MAG: hypothetical protein F6K17_43040 [Okeania sp. SIO3C4]|nr:hypothetical protein [Okeania sp. SIO3B3]NER08823.1 hypothetical protein [Okeania sp. SIO3C4]